MNINPNSKKNFNDEIILKFNPIIITEYLKWLSYISEKEVQQINELSEKPMYDLSSAEIENLKRFNESLKLIPLLKQYLLNNISNKDMITVHNYIMEYNIEDIMKSKLDDKEISEAMLIIDGVLRKPHSKLVKYALSNREEEVYNTLSMVEAYALYFIDKIYMNLSVQKIENLILNKYPNAMELEDYRAKEEKRVNRTLEILKKL